MMKHQNDKTEKKSADLSLAHLQTHTPKALPMEDTVKLDLIKIKASVLQRTLFMKR